MTKIIIIRELKNYIKNPLFYIGAILVFLGVSQQVMPWLGLEYFTDSSEIREFDIENVADGDILDGYIPASEAEQKAAGLERLRHILQEGFLMSQSEAKAVLLEVGGMTMPQICDYLEEHYSYRDEWLFKQYENLPGTVETINAYMTTKLEQENYTVCFSKKYTDFLGTYMFFYAVVLLAFLFIRDMRKDCYELLHTKPLKAWQYVVGKIGGGMLAMLSVVFVITLIYDILSVAHGRSAGFPVAFTDIWIPVLLYVVPNLLIVGCVFAVIALIFKNPLPAVPLLLVYAVYSNLGSVGPDGFYGYYGRIGAAIVRFPGMFFVTSAPPMAAANQMGLLAAAVMLMAVCSVIWKRRRIY